MGKRHYQKKNSFRYLMVSLLLLCALLLDACGTAGQKKEDAASSTLSAQEVQTEGTAESAEEQENVSTSEESSADQDTISNTEGSDEDQDSLSNAEKSDDEDTLSDAEGSSADTFSDENEESTENAAETQYYFRNEDRLEEHYEKHGRDMGFSSPEEYEATASAVVNDPQALHKTEAEDGDDVYYLEDTNDFVVVSGDGYIRTYFRPDAGKDYYDRQ